jgi:choline dehydrogenase-like flavoprotein
MRRVNINIQYSPRDIDSVIRAHRYWDDHLQGNGVGRLEYIDANLEESVLTQARNGFHQIGTTRMSQDPSKGVVDSDCKVHGVDNLFVASSSNFVTSGQANSTFMIVAFALRMADHLQRGAWLRSDAGGGSPPDA